MIPAIPELMATLSDMLTPGSIFGPREHCGVLEPHHTSAGTHNKTQVEKYPLQPQLEQFFMTKLTCQ